MHIINFKIALRNFWKNKGFSLINIGGLAIGLACCLLLLLYVNYEWGYDKQYKDADRIYYGMINLKINDKVLTTQASPTKLAGAALEELPGIATAARLSSNNGPVLFSYLENSFKLKAYNVDPAFLNIFDYDFIQGNPASALAEPDAVLITASTAKKLFGAENPLGKSIKWDDRKNLKVTAVIADMPKNQSLQFDVLQTWAFFEQENPRVKEYGWGMITCATYFKLKDGAAFATTDAALRKFIAKNDPKTSLEAFLAPYTKFHLYSEYEQGKNTGGRIDQVKLFLFLAMCVLLIACINYMNLSTARSEKRAREVGVRKALGASRNILMSQFVVESVLLSFLAMLVAFALLELSLPYFNQLLDITILINYQSYLFWLAIAGLILFTGVLAGSYPAFYLSSFIPVKVLKGFTSMGSSSLPIRKVLVVLQFTLSVCMIICAIIIYTQIQFLKNKPLGFEQNNMVQMPMEGELSKPGKSDIFIADLQKAGVITSGTQYSGSFNEGGNISGDVTWPGKSVKDNSLVTVLSTGYNFTETIGTTILKGRDFSRKFSGDSVRSVLINETGVKMMELKNPVGTVIKEDGKPFTIVGVVKDYFNEAPGEKVKGTLYYNDVNNTSEILLRLNPALPLSQSIAVINETSLRLNPAYPNTIEFINDNMQEKLQNEKVLSILSNLFGSFAIIISCLGLLGLALYMAEQRNKEISIRKVLGAGLGDILILLNKDFMKLVVISNLVAFPLAYVIAKNWLSKYDYKVSIALWPFLAAASISIVIAILTVSLQSVKVAKANAVDALKNN